MARIRGLLFALVAAGLLAATAEGASDGNDGRIAFERHAGDTDIYFVDNPRWRTNPDQPLEPRDLTPSSPDSDEENPTWAPSIERPDPSLLAFDSDRPLHGAADRDREIYVLTFDADSFDPNTPPLPVPEPFTDNAGFDDTEPAWAGDPLSGTPPEHTQPPIAFIREIGGNRELFIRSYGSPDPVETNVTQSEADESNPDWSPDGQQLAFERTTPGGVTEVWVARVGYEVVEGGADRYTLSDLRNVTPGQPPSFSPSWFRFSQIPVGAPAPGEESPPDAQSGQPDSCADNEGEANQCLFAPADRIVFAGVDPEGDREIYFASYEDDGTERPYANGSLTSFWQLTDNQVDDSSPAWAPLGGEILFQSRRDGRTRIYWMTQDGEDVQLFPITHDPNADDQNAAWQSLALSAGVRTRRPCGRSSTRPACRRALRISVLPPPGCESDPSLCPPPPPGCESDPSLCPPPPPGCESDPSLCPPPTCSHAGARAANTVVGTDGSDTLVGTNGRDLLCGLGGKDRLIGRGGADILLGAGGRDVLRGGAGPDLIRGGAGRDRLFGEAGVDQLYGGTADDYLRGGPGLDRLFGGAGDDVLHTRDRGPDRIFGGPGQDQATLDRRGDVSSGLEMRGN
jgi:hypothetical protein